jgi:hypothetical protein
MKTATSIAAAAVVLVVALLAMGASDPTGDGDDSIAQLRERVGALERRVEALEKQGRGKPATVRPATRKPSRSSGERSLREGWRRREFNGVPYYVIPVDGKQGRSHRQSALRGRR